MHSVSVFQTFTPADCFMLRARSLTLDSALPKIWLRFTIFAKLFHFVQFSLLWSFLRKLLRRPLTATNKSKTEPFWICFTHGCNAFFLTIRQSGFLNGQCPGERTDRAGLCKAHKARLCEIERNPRQPTANPLPQAEKTKNV